MKPVISIIMATYNRSNVLRFAIESVLNSTFTDWELIIVGDCCTDDTEQVVNSYDDYRIRWYNRSENFGEQSAANNEGFQFSRGDYICYLNQDDLYFPDHLQTSLETIQRSGADLVCSAIAIVSPSEQRQYRSGDWQCQIHSVALTGSVGRFTLSWASAWMVRRNVLKKHGPWPAGKDCYVAPSQILLQSLRKARCKVVFKPLVTVLAIQSGTRKDVYVNRESDENEYFWDLIANQRSFREELLNRTVMQLTANRCVFSLRDTLRRFTICTLSLLGLNPFMVQYVLMYRRRGALIKHLRRNRGLKPLAGENKS